MREELVEDWGYVTKTVGVDVLELGASDESPVVPMI